MTKLRISVIIFILMTYENPINLLAIISGSTMSQILNPLSHMVHTYMCGIGGPMTLVHRNVIFILK